MDQSLRADASAYFVASGACVLFALLFVQTGSMQPPLAHNATRGSDANPFVQGVSNVATTLATTLDAPTVSLVLIAGVAPAIICLLQGNAARLAKQYRDASIDQRIADALAGGVADELGQVNKVKQTFVVDDVASGSIISTAVTTAVVFAFLVRAINNTFGVSVTSVVDVLSAFVLGLGFGLREIIVNFLDGVCIQSSGILRVGDTFTFMNVNVKGNTSEQFVVLDIGIGGITAFSTAEPPATAKPSTGTQPRERLVTYIRNTALLAGMPARVLPAQPASL